MDTNNNIDLKKFKNINDFFSHQKDLFYNKIKNLDHDKIDNIKNIDKIYTDINYKENSEPSNNIYSDYINSSKSKNASVTPKITKTNVEIDDIFEIGTDSDERTEKLKRLYSASGVVYRFNRGITVIGKNGLKVEEVFDGTTMHHATSLVDICKECFGVEIPFNGISSDMESGIEAGNNGLISMLYEGNNCMIFIPEDLTISEIDEMIEEIEPRDKFIFSVVRSMDKYRIEITQDELLSYLRGLRETKKKEATKETPQEKNKISINEYINLVLRFIDEKNISLLDYYRNVGRQYRVREEDRLPEFERRNPFVDEGDIKLLVEKEDNKIVEYFARAMNKVINLNISKNHKKDPTKEGKYAGNQVDKNNKKTPIVPQNEKLSKSDYINAVLNFIKEKNISLIDYYRNVGRQYRVREEDILPEFERRNPFVDEGDIKLLVEKEDDKIVEYFARAMNKVINLNISKNHKKDSTKEGKYTGNPVDKNNKKTPIVPQNEKLSKSDYINAVFNFIKEKNISLIDYYRNVGRQYRVREEDRLPEFEKRNPFVDEGDIKLLVEKEDDKIVEYFARAIDRVITSNLGGKLNEKSKEEKPKEPTKDDTELTEMLDNEQVSQNEVITEDISFDTLDDYNGYVVVRDDKNINIYTYDSIDNTKLKNRVTYPSEKFNLKSGYYINLKDFLNEIRTKYQDSKVSFITESGTELDYNSVTKSLTDYCLEEGGIRLSNGKGEYLDDIFINRRDLKSFLSKFKVKYTIKKENNNQSVK